MQVCLTWSPSGLFASATQHTCEFSATRGALCHACALVRIAQLGAGVWEAGCFSGTKVRCWVPRAARQTPGYVRIGLGNGGVGGLWRKWGVFGRKTPRGSIHTLEPGWLGPSPPPGAAWGVPAALHLGSSVKFGGGGLEEFHAQEVPQSATWDKGVGRRETKMQTHSQRTPVR